MLNGEFGFRISRTLPKVDPGHSYVMKICMVATCALYALFKADALHALLRY